MRRVTVYDIAKEANVSVATVSRVLNNTAPVKKATKDKVLELRGNVNIEKTSIIL